MVVLGFMMMFKVSLLIMRSVSPGTGSTCTHSLLPWRLARWKVAHELAHLSARMCHCEQRDEHVCSERARLSFCRRSRRGAARGVGAVLSEQTGAAHFLAPLSTGVGRMAISAFCTDLFFPRQAKTVSHRE